MSDPRVECVTAWICQLCLDGKGGECHVPGCLFFMRDAPNVSIREQVQPCPSCAQLRADLAAMTARAKKPKAVKAIVLPVKILGANPPAGHKCSKECGMVKCMCGDPIHVEWLPDPPKPKTKRCKR